MAGDVPSSSVALPSHIGRYRIMARIGRGAMGMVYSAFDETIGRPVALKVLIADLEADPETLARFYREAQAAARLLHPNIITVYDAGEAQGRSYISMQLLEGAPLAAYLKQSEGAALERKLDLMIQVCEGLAAAHAEGIVHRDLKPSNLFVQSDGLLKILDFGVARVADSSMTAAGTMLGTPDYMSPEQARGDQVDARSDIFSAGAVFYFMVAGRKPFPGPDLPAVLHQLQHVEPSPLRGIPPELTSLISQAMAKNPDHRPGRVEQLLAGLVRFRRQHHGETRRMAVAVRAEFAHARELVQSLGELDAALQFTDPEPGAILGGLREQFPSLTGDVKSVDPVSFERGAVQGAMQAVQLARGELDALVERRRLWSDHVREAHRLFGERDAEGALSLVEAVLSECPESAAAQQLADRCQALAGVQRERSQRAARLLRAGSTALEGRDWSNAMARAREVLDFDPANVEASGLLARAEDAAAREIREREQSVQAAVARAHRAINRQAFDAAEEALAEAAAIDPAAASVAEAREHLASSQAAAAAAELLRQRTRDAIRRARVSFRRGRYDEAVHQLRGFVEQEPDAGSAAQELAALTSLRVALVAAADTSRAQSDAVLAQVQTALDSRRFDEAVDLARRALVIAPGRLDAVDLFEKALGEQLQARLSLEDTRVREQRDRQIAALLSAARQSLDRGWLGMALGAATAAQRLGGDRPAIQALVGQVRTAMGSEEDDNQPIELTSPAVGDEQGLWDRAADVLRGGFLRRKI